MALSDSMASYSVSYKQLSSTALCCAERRLNRGRYIYLVTIPYLKNVGQILKSENTTPPKELNLATRTKIIKMSCFDYNSSSASESDTSSTGLSNEDFRYPHIGTGTAQTHSKTRASKKRTWSETETDDESDLPGVPDYRVSNSYSRFSYDSDADSLNSDESEGNRETKRRRASDGQLVGPLAGSVRDMDFVKRPTSASAPKPTTTIRNILVGNPTSVRYPRAYRFINRLDKGLFQYFTLHKPSSLKSSELEPLPVTARPARVQHKPFVHTHPAPKPTTPIKYQTRRTALLAATRPTPALPRTTWLGVTNTWAFPSS